MKRKSTAAPANGALRSLADLKPDPNNANKGTTRGRALLHTSIREYGFGRSVLVDKHGQLIAGNKTVEAAGESGAPELVVVQTDGSQLVVVQRTDLDLSDSAARELAIADNRVTEVGLAWEPATLKSLQESGANLEDFFRPPEWAKLLNASEDVVADETLPEMECQPFEHHDYIMVVFRDSHAWTRACDLLGIRREGVTLGGRRKIGIGRVIGADRLFEILDGKRKK